jgi:rhodanese-related sulfurtransferase
MTARNAMLLAPLAALSLAVGALAAEEPFRMISVDEVAGLVGSKDARIYDANSAKEYAERHVPGAVHVSYKDLSARDLPEDHATRLVFYCMNPH